MNDQELMQSIKTKWGAEIDRAAGIVPASFLAALVANETGGDPTKKRFEPAVFGHLSAVLVGEQTTYGSLTLKDLFNFCADKYNPALPLASFEDSLKRLRSLATSWGLTQIMGYQVLGAHKGATIETLKTPADSLAFTTLLLVDFANEFHLNVLNDFADLFRCWNTGRPNGVTFDPEYVPNGLRRKSFYEALP